MPTENPSFKSLTPPTHACVDCTLTRTYRAETKFEKSVSETHMLVAMQTRTMVLQACLKTCFTNICHYPCPAPNIFFFFCNKVVRRCSLANHFNFHTTNKNICIALNSIRHYRLVNLQNLILHVVASELIFQI